MDTKRAILIYQYSEKIKSELIVASKLLAYMVTLRGKELSGAEKLMTSFLEALVGEIRIAQNIEKSINFIGTEKKIMEAIGRMKLLEYSKVDACISEALSLITTSCQGAVKVLMDTHLM